MLLQTSHCPEYASIGRCWLQQNAGRVIVPPFAAHAEFGPDLFEVWPLSVPVEQYAPCYLAARELEVTLHQRLQSLHVLILLNRHQVTLQ